MEQLTSSNDRQCAAVFSTVTARRVGAPVRHQGFFPALSVRMDNLVRCSPRPPSYQEAHRVRLALFAEEPGETRRSSISGLVVVRRCESPNPSPEEA